MKNREKIFIIAEAGVNHNGSIKMARELAEAAFEAGADAVKFQTFNADKLAATSAPKAGYQLKTTACDESQLDMIKGLELGLNEHLELSAYCKALGIEFMSTPFDLDSLDLLIRQIKVKRIKISSGDITNAPLLLKASTYGLPIILSTGMSTLGEIEQALGVLAFGYCKGNKVNPSRRAFRESFISDEGQEAIGKNVTLLHCTTEYPAPFDEVNLKVINTLKTAFGLPTGYSDHTSGIAIPIAASALGVCIIEKHFTLDKNLPGPDHQASIEPVELKKMVKAIRQVEEAMGDGIKLPTKSEEANMVVARRSLVALNNISNGEKFSEINIGVKRPGNGISPLYFWDFIGQQANKDYQIDELIEL